MLNLDGAETVMNLFTQTGFHTTRWISTPSGFQKTISVVELTVLITKLMSDGKWSGTIELVYDMIKLDKKGH